MLAFKRTTTATHAATCGTRNNYYNGECWSVDRTAEHTTLSHSVCLCKSHGNMANYTFELAAHFKVAIILIIAYFIEMRTRCVCFGARLATDDGDESTAVKVMASSACVHNQIDNTGSSFVTPHARGNTQNTATSVLALGVHAVCSLYIFAFPFQLNGALMGWGAPRSAEVFAQKSLATRPSVCVCVCVCQQTHTYTHTQHGAYNFSGERRN